MLPRWVHTFNAKEPVSAHSTPGPKHFATMLFINRTVALQIHLEHKFNNAYPELYDIMTRERKSSYKCTYARFASASTVGANQQISWSTRSQIAVVPIINMPFKRKYNSMRMHHYISDYNIMHLSGFARNILVERANVLYKICIGSAPDFRDAVVAEVTNWSRTAISCILSRSSAGAGGWKFIGGLRPLYHYL